MPKLLNNTLLYISAFFLSAVIYQFAKFVVASALNIDATLYLHAVDFHGFRAWTKPFILAVYASGPIACLIAAIIGFIILLGKDEENGMYYLFLIWFTIINFCFFLSEFISGPFYYEGLRVVMDWLYFPSELQLLFALIVVQVHFVIGIMVSYPILRTATSKRWIKEKMKRVQYLFLYAGLPYLLGSIAVAGLLFFLPGALRVYFFKIISISLIFITALFYVHSKRFVYIRRSSTADKLNVTFIIFVLVTLSVGYVAFWFGFGS